MDCEPAVIASLRRAVAAMPDDLPLRLHLASLLLTAGQRDESIRHLGTVVAADPVNPRALELLREAASAAAAEDRTGAEVAQHGPAGDIAGSPATSPAPGPPPAAPAVSATPSPAAPPPGGQAERRPPAHEVPADADRGSGSPPQDGDGFDWTEAETQMRGVLPPMFVTADGAAAEEPADAAGNAGQPVLRLADVAGMAVVKARLEAAFLAPLRNPDLRRLYRKSLRGGLLLYGPPGCGKTFIARAVAGELGASFLAVSFADVIDMLTGQSERNIRELFTIARRRAPCVLFLDEVDALGQKRSQLRSAPVRSAVNQLLLELDDVAGGNEGVFVLAASNHPWDVDSALRRPGRLDRTVLVLPPDEAARAAVFRFHLRGRPVTGIELTRLAAMTDGYSAADIAHVCESAAELALLDSARSGEARLIGQADLATAVTQVSPSIGPWLESARNVALFANEGGTYDELAAYLRGRRLL
ncbi:MAG TPA: ATP-binding protein [Streptosporangiaceae bacterium]|nr:ATP-binding protein [Streptosporangiaceae bacterium]